MISNAMMIYDDADLLEYMIYWFHHWIFVCCLDAARCHQCLSNLVFNLNPVQYFEIFEIF